MPLLDHFRPPLAVHRHWESFHTAWAAEMMRSLNRRVLPKGYFAEAQVHVGSRVEVDVATFEEQPALTAQANGNAGGLAVETWAPPQVMPAHFPDEIEVQVLNTTTGANLVAAIELISPGNKDRPDARRVLAGKCASYLHMGIGLVIVDIVTDRPANLHDDLVDLLEQSGFRFPGSTMLYAVAYRPARKSAGDQIEFWQNPLSLGQSLPTLPLALRGGPTVALDLEASYMEVCRDARLENL